MDSLQVEIANEFYSFLGTDPGRLKFKVYNIYDLLKIKEKFDRIICSETMEHITRDKLVVEYSYDALRESGVLHLCCSFSDHPVNKGRVCTDESGGWHVRDGYTMESYRALLETAGFEIVKSSGLGAPLLAKMTNIIQPMFSRMGAAFAFPLFLLSWPLQLLDYEKPKVPRSLYVQCVKKPQNAK